MWTALLKPAFGIVKEWITGKQEEAKQKRELQAANAQRRKELILDKTQKDADWELAALADKDRFGRRLLLLSTITPVIITAVAPAYGAAIWAALATVPQAYYGVIGVVYAFYFGSKNAPELLAKFAEAIRGRKTPPSDGA